MPSEFDFIAWVRSQTRDDARVVLPPGDDLAVCTWAHDDLLVVGADQVLDGVHFDSAIHAPRDIGRKAMNRNLSDCAAMGCLPAFAVVTAALPRGGSMDYAKEIHAGLTEAGAAFDCTVVGGDTGSWNGKLALSVAILGRSGGVQPITRSGAKPGDAIHITGPLGGSILGRHMHFTPRVAEGRALAASGVVTSMLDLSDGLSRDLRHICEQGNVGAIIDAEKVWVHEDALEMRRRDGRSPLEHALHDGEDYELLFTVSGTSAAGANIPFPRIGTIVAEPGTWLQRPDGSREPLAPLGFEHTL